MTRYIWLFNTSAYSKTRAEELARLRGVRGDIVFADPRPEKNVSTYDLKRQSIIGVYEKVS